MSIVRVPFSLTGGGAAAYVPAGAIWLDGSADYLSKTFGVNPTSDKTYTLSWWWKITEISSGWNLIHSSGGDATVFLWNSSSGDIRLRWSNTITSAFVTNNYLRDFTAWYHCVLRVDTTQATAANRIRFYINGTEASYASTNYPAQNATDELGANGNTLSIGQAGGPDQQFSEFIYCDGQSYGPDNFGEYDTNGNWIPKDPTGLTFGTNGSWLNFADSANLGNDVSGNNNDYTPTSMSSANYTSDRCADKVANNLGNYATLSPLFVDRNNFTLSNHNLTATTSSTNSSVHSTLAIPPGAKVACTAKFTTLPNTLAFVGVCDMDQIAFEGGNGLSLFYGSDGQYYNNSSWAAYGATFTTNDVITIEVDRNSDTIEFFKNGSSQGQKTMGADAYAPLFFTFRANLSSGSGVVVTNFGDGGNVAITSGFSPLSTAVYPAPTVTDPSKYFNTVLYTGISGENAITGVGFQPDFVWIKDRDFNTNHQLVDVVRGATKELNSNTDGAETTVAQGVKSFDSDGFTLGTDAGYNDPGTGYVAWCWKAGGAVEADNNSEGTLTSTVSTAAHGGFSIGTYTMGTSAATGYTIGHGLSTTPDLIIDRVRNVGPTDWHIYSKDTTTPAARYLYLNYTLGEQTSTTIWNNTQPSPTVYSVSTSYWGTDGFNHVFYAFARTPGLIGIGSYKGNGVTDGPYVVVDDGGSGFRPAFVLVKKTNNVSATGDASWNLLDSSRDTYNVADHRLFPDSSVAENTSIDYLDFTSGGFKIRTSNFGINAAGDTYIYLAFAEFPFGGSGVAQAKAR